MKKPLTPRAKRWAELLKIAGRQHGLVSRPQLIALGVKPNSIRTLVRTEKLVRIHAGVYALPTSKGTRERHVLAAILAAGDAVASHQAAARLHGFEVEDVIALSVVNSKRPRLKSFIRVYRVAKLPPEHRTRVNGIAATSVARTICDLAAVLARDELELVLDRALSKRLVTVADVAKLAQELGRHRKGSGMLRELLAARTKEGRARVQSAFEQALLALLRAEGITGWVPQLEVAFGDGRSAFIDVAFPDVLLGIEPEGAQWHEGNFVKDRKRQAKLTALGWRLLPITYREFHEDRAEVARRIHASLAAARRSPVTSLSHAAPGNTRLE